MKAMLALAEILAAINHHGKPVRRSAPDVQLFPRPTVSTGRHQFRGIKHPAALRTARREPHLEKRIFVRVWFANKSMAAGASRHRVKWVNDLGNVVDEVPREVELDLVVTVHGVRGIVERQRFERIAEAA